MGKLRISKWFTDGFNKSIKMKLSGNVCILKELS